MEPALKVDGIRGCARCGGDHPGEHHAKRFAIPFAPPEANGVVWTYWLTCPETGDPILISQVDEIPTVLD